MPDTRTHCSLQRELESLVRTNHDCRISYPFYYLKSDRFWKLIPRNGSEDLDRLGAAAKSLTSLDAAVESAELADDLYLLVKDDESNHLLQKVLLEEYFPATQSNLMPRGEHYGILDEIKNKIITEDSSEYRKEIQQLLEKKDEEEIFLRGSLFRREIPRIYNNTCCISGMRERVLRAYKNQCTLCRLKHPELLDTAHIIGDREDNGDPVIQNGLCLCKIHHAAFDNIIIGITPDFQVKIRKDVLEEIDGPMLKYGLQSLNNNKIILPSIKSEWPDRDRLDQRYQRFINS